MPGGPWITRFRPFRLSRMAAVCVLSASTTWLSFVISTTSSRDPSSGMPDEGSLNPSSSKALIIEVPAKLACFAQPSGSRSRYISNLPNEKNPRTISSRWTFHRGWFCIASSTSDMNRMRSKSSEVPREGNVIPNSRRSFSIRDRLSSISSPEYVSLNLSRAELRLSSTGTNTSGARRMTSDESLSYQCKKPRAR